LIAALLVSVGMVILVVGIGAGLRSSKVKQARTIVAAELAVLEEALENQVGRLAGGRGSSSSANGFTFYRDLVPYLPSDDRTPLVNLEIEWDAGTLVIRKMGGRHDEQWVQAIDRALTAEGFAASLSTESSSPAP
jgi:hypothetical protein